MEQVAPSGIVIALCLSVLYADLVVTTLLWFWVNSINVRPLRLFRLRVDEKFLSTLEELRVSFKQQSCADVIRLGIAALKLAIQEREVGNRLCLYDEGTGKLTEIVLPEPAQKSQK